ncbi:MAG TPA: acetamidase/formamidase family protein [Methylomirabilota bacterium]|jgi:formamidase|nr:acetamidase/formamidase family protein [Methylomirabilota bacterium]
MAIGTAVYIAIDRSKTLSEEPNKGHNRWHPDIPPIVRVDPGQVVGLETRDALDAQVHPNSTAADLLKASLGVVHPLTGPVYVNGAEPGDLLAVKIEEIDPQPFGFTVQAPGFGFLRDLFTEPYLVRWTIANGFATSPDLPGVRIPGAPFMGVMGLAPSHELLERINRREADLAKRGGAVFLPDAAGATPADPRIAQTALRTIAPHETGGNLDVKQLTKGTTLRMPVYVPGALFSVGDAHFAQGDGESCGTAVEMGATCYCSFNILKGAAQKYGVSDVQFYRSEYFTSPEMAAPRRFFATTGQSYTREGVAHAEDATLAARNALLNMIDYLVHERGFTRQQAYAICSVAVDLKISEVVDVPNFVVSAFLPLDIFV